MSKAKTKFKYYLKCWHCRTAKAVFVDNMPEVPTEVGADAETIGWIAVCDMPYARVLTFCSDQCNLEAMEVDGSYPEVLRRIAA